MCRHKSFWRGTKCSQIFGLAQKILTDTKHLVTYKRTRHMTFLKTSALSFYRPQNALGWSKLFVPDQKFIYILWQSQIFFARQKYDLHSIKLFFCQHKSFWRGTKCSQIFGLAQKILTGTKHLVTCKRTRHKFHSEVPCKYVCIMYWILYEVHIYSHFMTNHFFKNSNPNK